MRCLLLVLVFTLATPPGSAASQSISTSPMHACATTAKGAIYCWGQTMWWPDNPPRWLPDSAPLAAANIGRRAHYDSIASGWLHDCALARNGRVACKGVNNSGELGRGGIFDQAPRRLATSLRFRSIRTGQSHTCALTAHGVAYCWGRNDAGQAGDGSRREMVLKPTAVVGGHRFRVLTAGSRHTCGITRAGITLCWGANNRGQLGRDPGLVHCAPDKACMAVPRPLDEKRRFIEIAAGWEHTCAIAIDHTIYCWGDEFSQYAQTGREFAPIALTSFRPPVPLHALSAGRMTSCALADDGRAFCWGPYGLGRAYRRQGCRGVDWCLDSLPIAPGIRFRAVSAGYAQSCGIGRSGAVYCWGAHDTRQHDSNNQPLPPRASCTGLFVRPATSADGRVVVDPQCAVEPYRVLMPNVFTGEQPAPPR